jgi:hypothetical protein
MIFFSCIRSGSESEDGGIERSDRERRVREKNKIIIIIIIMRSQRKQASERM